MDNKGNEEDNLFEYRKDFIYKAIEDTTNTIRFLDTKVGAVFLVISVVLASLVGLKDSISESFIYFKDYIIHFFIFVVAISLFSFKIIISIYYGFIAIYSKDNPKEHIDTTEIKNKNMLSLWYLLVDNKTKMVNPSMKIYLNNIKSLNKNDLIEQIAIEHFKLSYIRHFKLENSNKCIKFFRLALIPLILILLYIMFYYLIPNKCIYIS